jgi:hypothetical protein
VFFRRSRPATSDSPTELDELGAALGAAADKFGRELGRHFYSRRKARQSRSTTMPARLSSPPRRRLRRQPQPHPLRLPQKFGRGTAPTVLSRDRDRRGRPLYALEIEARAEGFADRIRRQLLGLRGFLARLRDFFRWRHQPGLGVRRLRTTRSTESTRTRADGVLTALVLVTTAGLGLELIAARRPAIREAPRAGLRTVAVSDALDARIEDLAHAIAVAEGYFAAGPHGGHTLPHVLNNPGALKKPALGAGDLPTWKDTGLVWFPDAEVGWNALRHQVRLMLTGASGIYAHSDSLISVGDKYADGDVNWGVNVATTLGVPPALTLGDLAPPE